MNCILNANLSLSFTEGSISISIQALRYVLIGEERKVRLILLRIELLLFGGRQLIWKEGRINW